MQSLFRSLRRDWISWSRIERVSALGLFAGAPLAVFLTAIVRLP